MNKLFETTEGGFKDKYAFLSNMYPCDIILPNGERYHCSEQLYQLAKVYDPDIKDKIYNCDTGYKAKRLSRKVVEYYTDDHKIKCMNIALQYKFNIPELADMLVETGNIEIVEYNTWGDTFWGVCNGEGHNMLGRMLMAVRCSKLQHVNM